MPDIFIAEPEVESSPKKPEAIVETKEKPTKPSPVVDDPANHHTHVHLLSSFCRNPGDISFQNQDKDEKVLLFVRKAHITNLKWVLMSIFLISIPLLLSFIQIFIPFVSFSLPGNSYLTLLILYYLIVATYVYVSFITWYFNISLVTNKKVVDVDFSGIVYKNVASTTLSLVQDVNYSQVGVIRTFFDYGDVLVQTAGTMENFDFDAIPQPESVVHLVGDLIGRHK